MILNFNLSVRIETEKQDIAVNDLTTYLDDNIDAIICGRTLPKILGITNEGYEAFVDALKLNSIKS